ncbi:hypothetical protein LGK95_19020 [Clostridium algoriphilum]|uniref:hypothetical protein n=1 Tax=Clostridium algoriphilum TaxID=198347 RepID=UPI001CF21BE0|nr:hypothetical protein [Clostridium algoriphilum]MCB2295574.1 hypothetical protein [Clostridium algoriphilum]
MNYLDKLTKDIKSKQRKRKGNSINNFAAFAILGVTIGGAFAGVFVRKCIDELKNIIVSNAMNSDEDISTKRDEIKQTLEKAPDESVGDVGVAMEKAFEDLEEDEQDESEATK